MRSCTTANITALCTCLQLISDNKYLPAGDSSTENASNFLFYCYTDQVPYGEFSNWWMADMKDEAGTVYRSTGLGWVCLQPM